MASQYTNQAFSGFTPPPAQALAPQQTTAPQVQPAQSYQAISGPLPWTSGGGGAFTAANPAELGQQYIQAYNSSVAQNRSNYDNIMQGYQDTLKSQTSAQEAIGAGYTSLYNNVIGGLKGIGQERDNQINTDAVRAAGAGTQSLIDRGLGNTTVQQSVNRGVESDRNKSLTENANAVAGLTASYQNQIGGAQLQQQQQAADRNTALSQDQLRFMNSLNAGYPDAGLYAQLSQQFGQSQAAQRNADLYRQQQAGAGGAAGNDSRYAPSVPPIVPGTPPRLGYVPSAVHSQDGGAYPSVGPQGTGLGGGTTAGMYGSSAGAGYPTYSGGSSAAYGGIDAGSWAGNQYGAAQNALYGAVGDAGAAQVAANVGSVYDQLQDYGGGGDF